MTNNQSHRVPIVPGLSFVPKKRGILKFGPKPFFCPINPGSYYPNEKYMISHDQFKDKKAPILKFIAYFDDRNELPRDQMKFRNIHILYFVEDGTIKVYEPLQKNARFPQGCLINRNRIPKPDGGYYELSDLNLGKELLMYGKTFKILDCDPFTKNYLKEMGYRVGSPEPPIVDPVYADRQEMDMHRTSIQKPRKKEYRLAKFYNYHPKCLHFYVIYNNKPCPYEEIRYASLYYSLSDSTIKITDEKKLLEYKRQISVGNYDTYLILKPTLVPKRLVGANPIGKNSTPVILNLNADTRYKRLEELMCCRAGGANNLTEFLRDSNPERTAEEVEEYFTALDFDLGITLDIFGFEVYIYDCDEFTKEFYRYEFQKELKPVALPEIKVPKYPISIHKDNFGSSENTIETCRKLPSLNMPKELMNVYVLSQNVSHKGTGSDNLLKFYLNCRNGCDSNVLTYLANVITSDVFLKDENFLIRWYLEDETMEIIGLDMNFTFSDSTIGTFLRRMKLAKPSSEMKNSGKCFYSAKDMFVGNVIYAIKKPFLITDADEYTYDFMERKCEIFINSNVRYIMATIFPRIRDKVLRIQSSFENYDLGKSGLISYNDFKNTLTDIVPQDQRNQFPEQQIKTLARFFAHEDYVGLKNEQLISMIQTELKKQRFEDFEKLETLFRVFDMDNNTNQKGYLKPSQIYNILRSYPLIIDRDLLKSFVFKFPQCNGLIPYEEIVKKLNYFENAIEPPDLTPYAININWERVEKVKNLNKICYPLFLKELTRECPNCP